MKISQNNYIEYVEAKSPKSNQQKTIFMSFFVGGLICTFGQLITEILREHYWVLGEDLIGATTSAILIFIGATLTGLGLYDRIGAIAGAGSMVPITGFANSVVSPALEFKQEGMIYGLAAKMFTIAGPIILYGTVGSAIVGVIYYVFKI